MQQRIERYRARLARTTRRQAFLTHAAVSAGVVALVCACIVVCWYPPPYFRVSQIWDVLRILIAVDLILGPLLTLIVFKPDKPSLLFDLGVIASVQIVALVYGTATIYQQRPYYVVFAVDRFEILTRDAVAPASIGDPALRRKPWRGPILAAALRPTDPAGLQRLLQETLFEGQPDIHLRPEFWRPLAAHRDLVTARAEPADTFRTRQPSAAAAVAAVERGHRNRTIGLLPIMRGTRVATLAIDRATGEFLAAIPIDYWDADPPRSAISAPRQVDAQRKVLM